MATRITPYVHSREEIINFPQVVNGAEEVIAMPIISDMGPVTPIIVNNRQLLKYFTGDTGIKRSDDKSLKMAYILSRYSNLMVTRVVKDAVTDAIKVTSDGFFKTKYNHDEGRFTDEQSLDDADNDPLFAVYCNYAYSNDICGITIRSEETKSPFEGDDSFVPETKYFIRLEVYNNDMSNDIFNEEYEFSLDKDKVDGFGNSLLIDRINDLQSYFKIVYYQNSDTLEKIKISVTLGDSGYDNPVKYTPTGLIKTDDFSSMDAIKNAYIRIQKYRRDVKIKVLFDGGLSNNVLTNTISQVAQKRKTLGVFSLPVELTTFEDLKSSCLTKFQGYNTNAGASSYLYCAAPAKVDDTYLGWREKLPYSLYYIMTIYNNISMNKEFAPVFGKKTGLVDGSNITIDFEYSNDYEDLGSDDVLEIPETELLQRLSVNPVVYDQSLGTAFFVNNLTYQTPNLNVLSEENNRRLFNSIQFDINKMLDNFLAEANNEVTRQLLDDALTNYKTTVLDPMGYTVRGIRWRIEDYDPAKRNTLELTVEVCFMDSIKYIEVLYRAIPVLNS